MTREEFEAEKAKLDDQERGIRQVRRALVIQMAQSQAGKNRAQIQATLTPEQLKAQANIDNAFLTVFGDDTGKMVLEVLITERPIVADEIKERIARANAAKLAAHPGG